MLHPSKKNQEMLPESWLRLALAAGSLCLAIPLFSVEYLPLLDLPQHIGSVAILSGANPDHNFEIYYETQLLSSPYLLTYLIASVFAWVTGPLIALKLLFAASIVTLPWATAYAARSFQRDPLVALFISPLCYGSFFFLGFLNFVFSLPLLLFFLGWWHRQSQKPNFGWQQFIAGMCLTVLLFLGHVLILGFALLAVPLISATARGKNPFTQMPGREELRRMLHAAPSMILLLVWLIVFLQLVLLLLILFAQLPLLPLRQGN